MERLKILIVDDEEELASAMAERLALRGFQADTVSSGAEALRFVSAGDFSVLIIDVKMPGLDGLSLMAEVKRTHPALPVILFTGQSSLAEAERGMRQGAFDYLVKPIDIDTVIEKIRAAADGKRGRQP